MGANWELAKRSAWQHFGKEYWRWFVFGPIIVRLMAGAVVVAGLLLGGLYVVQHVGGWLEWLGWLVSAYLLPMLLIALGALLYGVVVVVFWRLNSWKWKLRGFSTARYTLCTMSLLIISVTLIGATL